MKSVEELEKKINKIKGENREFRKKIASLKKENSSLEKALRYKDIIYDNAPAGIVVILDKKILEANDTFLELTGCEREEVVNRNYLDFIDPSSLAHVKNRHNKWKNEKIKRDQYDAGFINRTGEPVICSVESKRVRYRGRASYALNITRLEERKKAEESKRKEIKNRVISGMINGFRYELERNTASIMKMATLANKETETVKKLKVLISKIESLANNLAKQIHMLKVINDENREQDEKERFNINNVIEDAVGSIENSFSEIKNEIAINTYFRSSSSIEGKASDLKEALIQILIHLTENMPGGGDIHITTEENTDLSYIYIQDDSTGKEKGSSEDLFYPYYEKNSPGLAYSRALISSYGGSLEFIAGKEEGTIFQIIFPLAPEVKGKKKIDKGRLKKSRILIIQEDDVARELMSHFLIDRGCLLDTARSSLEGLAKIKKNRVDLVVADTVSLEMDRNNFLKNCNKLKPNMLTVCIGDHKGENIKNKNGLITPDLFISKPIEINGAVKKIAQLLMTEK